MAIDLLGKEPPKKTAKTSAEVIFHQPGKDKKPDQVMPPRKVEPPKPKPLPARLGRSRAKEELGEVNLMTSFKAYLLKRRIYILLVALIVFLLIGLVVFYLLTRPTKIVNSNLNLAVNNTNQLPVAICGNGQIESGEQCDFSGCNINQSCENCQCQEIVLPAPVCGNGTIETGEQCDQSDCGMGQNCVDCQCQAVIPPEPVCGNGRIEAGEQCDTISLIGCTNEQTCVNCLCQTVVLPDTELAPLRGALVKFAGSSEVYLVEWHGELRLLNQQTVVFKSGQTVKSVTAKNQVYSLNSSYEGIRQGSKVSGYIDWDPRILAPEELEPFK